MAFEFSINSFPFNINGPFCLTVSPSRPCSWSLCVTGKVRKEVSQIPTKFSFLRRLSLLRLPCHVCVSPCFDLPLGVLGLGLYQVYLTSRLVRRGDKFWDVSGGWDEIYFGFKEVRQVFLSVLDQGTDRHRVANGLSLYDQPNSVRPMWWPRSAP